MQANELPVCATEAMVSGFRKAIIRKVAKKQQQGSCQNVGQQVTGSRPLSF